MWLMKINTRNDKQRGEWYDSLNSLQLLVEANPIDAHFTKSRGINRQNEHNFYNFSVKIEKIVGQNRIIETGHSWYHLAEI